MQQKKLFFLLFFLSLFLWCSCEKPFYKQHPQQAIELKIIRLDKEIFNKNFTEIKNKRGFDFLHYTQLISPEEDTMEIEKNWDQLLGDSFFVTLQKEIDKKFENTSDLEKKIGAAFAQMRYHFPDFEIPKLYGVNSGFNFDFEKEKNNIYIGLDFFLGNENFLLKQSDFPQYLQLTMDSAYLPIQLMHFLLIEKYQKEPQIYNFLEIIISLGKTIYLLDCTFPDEPDYLKIRYTKNELEQAQSAKKEIWSYILQEKMLYQTDKKRINAWIQWAPFVNELSPDLPGRLGVFLGWDMIRNYMLKSNLKNANELLKANSTEIISLYQL